MKFRHVIFVLSLAILGSSAIAQSAKIGDITINHAWARATVPGQQSGGGFLSITNSGTADRLVSASAEVSDLVELHTMKMEGDVMKMAKVDGIDLPAGKTVDLKPGSFHIMFINLKAPLKEGNQLQLKLKFEKAGDASLVVPVKALASMPMNH